MADEQTPDPPATVRGAASDRESARQRQAAMSAPFGAIREVSGAARMVLRIESRVEALVSEGASEQEIVESIRAESPEIAEVVEKEAPEGADFAEWVKSVVMPLLTIAFMYYVYLQQSQDAEQTHEDLTQIAQLLEAILRMLGGGSSSGGSHPVSE